MYLHPPSKFKIYNMTVGKACASFLRKFGSCFSQFVENVYFNQKDIFLTYHLNDWNLRMIYYDLVLYICMTVTVLDW